MSADKFIATGAAVAFLAIAAGVVWWQRRHAGSCARHSRAAGIAAWVIAGICAAIGATLVAFVLVA